MECAPEDSPFKNAHREDWSEDKYFTAGIVNELRILRSEQVAIHAGQDSDPILLKSPAQQLAEEEGVETQNTVRAGIMAQLQMKIE